MGKYNCISFGLDIWEVLRNIEWVMLGGEFLVCLQPWDKL